MIRILHFITDTNIGGAGRLLCNQIKNMGDSGFEIFVALPRESLLCAELRALPCTIIGMEHGADRSFTPRAVFEARKIIKKIAPDIVHSHGSLSSRLAATALGVKSRIFTRHCVFPLKKRMKNPLYRLAVGSANNLCSTAMVAVADSARQNLLDMGCSGKKIRTVINGSPPMRVLSEDEIRFERAKHGLTNRNFVVSIFARLEEYKGHVTFLRAAQICKRFYPSFRFFIVGEGSKRQELEQLAQELKIGDVVRFIGFCRDVAPLFAITDVNVNCSWGTETSSLALSEGMSLGIPCVASDYGGNPHMVKNAVNGLLFPAKNADALAGALIRLFRDTNLYSKCSIGALRRYREEFTDRAMTEKMMEIYREEFERTKK